MPPCFASFFTASSLHAVNTFWTGPIVTFVHAANTTNYDAMTTNHVGADSVNNVWLTRGTQFPLYNAAAESGWNGSTPANTMWSLASPSGLPPFPPLTTAGTNIYDIFANVVGHPGGFPGPGRSVGKNFLLAPATILFCPSSWTHGATTTAALSPTNAPRRPLLSRRQPRPSASPICPVERSLPLPQM